MNLHPAIMRRLSLLSKCGWADVQANCMFVCATSGRHVAFEQAETRQYLRAVSLDALQEDLIKVKEKL